MPGRQALQQPACLLLARYTAVAAHAVSYLESKAAEMAGEQQQSDIKSDEESDEEINNLIDCHYFSTCGSKVSISAEMNTTGLHSCNSCGDEIMCQKCAEDKPPGPWHCCTCVEAGVMHCHLPGF